MTGTWNGQLRTDGHSEPHGPYGGEGLEMNGNLGIRVRQHSHLDLVQRLRHQPQEATKYVPDPATTARLRYARRLSATPTETARDPETAGPIYTNPRTLRTLPRSQRAWNWLLNTPRKDSSATLGGTCPDLHKHWFQGNVPPPEVTKRGNDHRPRCPCGAKQCTWYL